MFPHYAETVLNVFTCSFFAVADDIIFYKAFLSCSKITCVDPALHYNLEMKVSLFVKTKEYLIHVTQQLKMNIWSVAEQQDNFIREYLCFYIPL